VKNYIVYIKISGRGSALVEAENEAEARKIVERGDAELTLDEWDMDRVTDVEEG
jgi:hypothetical protein